MFLGLLGLLNESHMENPRPQAGPLDHIFTGGQHHHDPVRTIFKPGNRPFISGFVQGEHSAVFDKTAFESCGHGPKIGAPIDGHSNSTLWL